MALIAFWRSGLEDAKGARPWLYRVVRNAAIDLLRKKSRSPTLMPDPDKTAAWDYAPEELAMSREEAEFMGRFINSLAKPDQELCFLTFAEDLSYPEIAKLTGKALGTIKWRMAAIKRRLCKVYKKELG